MATINIDGAQVFPQDVGTDAPTTYEQPESAGHLAGLAYHDGLTNYALEGGLEFNPDFGTSSLDITAGGAHVLVDTTVSVQATRGGDYVDTWHPGVNMVVNVPGTTGLSLTAGAKNHVFLAIDLNQGDGAYYEINTTGEQPTDPYVKLGVVDTDANTYSITNRRSDFATVSEIESAEADISDLDGRVTTNESDISDLDGRVTTNESDISDLDAETSNLNSRVSTNETDISNLESETSSLNSRVSTNETDISDLESQGHVYVVDSGDPLPSEAGPGDLVGYRE